MKMAMAEAQTNLEHVQRRMANVVNRSTRSEKYKVSDEMVLNIDNLRSCC